MPRFAAPKIVPATNAINSLQLITIQAPEGTEIYFTVTGKAPDPFARQGRSSDTVRYTQAFTLNAGKRVVKAVSIDPHNRTAEPSSVSTRNYVVAHADEVHGDRDGVRAPPHTQKWTTTAADILDKGSRVADSRARDGGSPASSSASSSDDDGACRAAPRRAAPHRHRRSAADTVLAAAAAPL